MPVKNPGAQSVRDAILSTRARLDKAGVYCGHGTDNTLDEAAWLVGGALRIPPAELDAHLTDALTAAQRTQIEVLVEKRARERKPTAYLLNEAWFAGLAFYVDERVIIPRSLTAEFIQEQFAPWIEPTRVRRILDLCTGSGCMAIAAAHAFPQAQIAAADISADALAVARINVERHRLTERVRLVQSDLYASLVAERYDVVMTNPPYVARRELRDLPAEYAFEPSIALASGEHGLEAVFAILAGAAAHLEPRGLLVAEVGNSHAALQRALPEVPFIWLTTSTGDESVFLLTTEQLSQHAATFAQAASRRA